MCYNNGKMELPSGSNYGGVAFTMTNCTLTNVVDTSLGALAYFATQVTGSGCYAQRSTSGITPAPSELAPVTLSLNNYRLIVENNGGYKAHLQKV